MSQGRYEVAVDSQLDFRVRPPKGVKMPPLERFKAIAESQEPMLITFEGRRFVWHPNPEGILPTVTVMIEDSDDYEAERFAMERFLSALSFRFGGGIAVYSQTASGYKKELDPPLLQQPRMKPNIHPPPAELELADSSSELSLCLGLMREGSSSSSLALRYLSYWKTIEVAIGDPQHKDWIGKNAEAMRDNENLREDEWFERLNGTRKGAAHALPYDESLTYNPDDPANAPRLRDDVGLMFELRRERSASAGRILLW